MPSGTSRDAARRAPSPTGTVGSKGSVRRAISSTQRW